MNVQNIFKPPMYRNETDEERRATWTELFYDLAFVVAISVIGHELSAHFDLMGVATFIVSFTALWISWVNSTFYSDRYDSDDLIHRLLTFLQMVGIIFFAVFAHEPFGVNYPLFFLSYAAIRSVIAFSFLRAAYYIPKTRPATPWFGAGVLLALIPWAIGLVVDSEVVRMILASLGLLISFILPFLTPKARSNKVNVNYEHISERFGLFTILILGEAFVSIVNATGKLTFSGLLFISILLGALLVFLFWWLYFENLESDSIKDNRTAGFIWVYTHLPLMIGLVMLALGIEQAILESGGIVSDYSKPALINYAWGFVFACFSIISFVTTYKGEKKSFEISQGLVFLLSATVSVLLVFAGVHNLPVWNMLFIAIMGAMMIFVDVAFQYRCGNCKKTKVFVKL